MGKMKIQNFSTFIKEDAVKTIVFSFGRFNPPTIGHLKLLDKLSETAKREKGIYRMYLSQSEDKKKNPLNYSDKIKFARKMFPKHARNIIYDKKIKTTFDVLAEVYDQGFTRVIMVVGNDRLQEFDSLLNKYNGVKHKHGFYNFENGIEVISAGDRDPDSNDIDGVSASKMREFAASHDYASFMKGLPSNYKEGKKLFNAVRKGMGLKESYNFRNHISLGKTSKIREKYIEGDLFVEGDEICLKDNLNIKGFITYCGPNYVIFETSNKGKKRAWLHSIRKL